MISSNYVDGLELKIKELSAELNKYKEIARQYTKLASQGIYYNLEDLYEHDKLIAKSAFIAGAARQRFCDDSGIDFDLEDALVYVTSQLAKGSE
jgi:hypothetical protein